ncbi:MAG: sulfur reduction protein DsrE [Bacilli bacterium]|nr:sulfur reduction protein DsrE [Bacilli bacterium]
MKTAISITYGKNNAERATFAFMMANNSLASGHETVVFLNLDGVYLATDGYADDIHVEDLPKMKDLLDKYLDNGGVLWVCGTCFNKRKLNPESLIKGARIIGQVTFLEFLSKGAVCINY